jgi:hypothetical protein
MWLLCHRSDCYWCPKCGRWFEKKRSNPEWYYCPTRLVDASAAGYNSTACTQELAEMFANVEDDKLK